MSIQISKNFTMEELTASQTAAQKGIMNLPDAQQMCNLCALVHNVLQPLRTRTGLPVRISSGFRSAALNKAVGGVANSQHTTGQAADITIGSSNQKIFIDCIIKNLDFDQLILEHNSKGTYWLHVSYRSDGKNRKQYIDNLLKK